MDSYKTIIFLLFFLSMISCASNPNKIKEKNRQFIDNNLVQIIQYPVDIGQGILVAKSNKCYLLAPLHIVTEEDRNKEKNIIPKQDLKIVSNLWGTKRIIEEADVKILPYRYKDIRPMAILGVIIPENGDYPAICGELSRWPSVCDSRKLAKRGNRGLINYRIPHEPVASFGMQVTSGLTESGNSFIVTADEPILKGKSGSIVSISGRAIGILTHLYSNKVGRVYPLDYISESLDKLDIGVENCPWYKKHPYLTSGGIVVGLGVIAALIMSLSNDGGSDDSVSGITVGSTPVPEP